jgi:hypothetical protein
MARGMANTTSTAAMLVQVVVCLASLALLGCERRPVVVDTLGTLIDSSHFGNLNDARQFARVIVVATIEENRVVAKHVEAARYRGVYLDLHEVRCRLENSLRGDITGPALTFYYFANGKYPDSKPNPRYKQLFEAVPGYRYLLFLTSERDVLRSIGDVGSYSIRIATGTHPHISGEIEDHCCPARSRTESVGCRDRVNRHWSRVLEVPVKWAFSQKA